MEHEDGIKKKGASRKKDSSDYIAATVYFPKEMSENLKLMAGELGMSKTSYIINAVNEKFERDACKDRESRSLTEIKKIRLELETLDKNVNTLATSFNFLKSAVTKALDLT